MSASTQDPSDQLSYAQTCWFCGGRPTIVWVDELHFVIACRSVNCSAQPQTNPRESADADTEASERAHLAEVNRAVTEWNTQARRQPRLVT